MADLSVLEAQIGIKFENRALYERAFVHKSFTNESEGNTKDNERLEFLGDAVLELITTEELFDKYTDKPEGELTAMRSALVRGRHLAEVSKALNFGSYLLLSKGENNSGGREKDYILANTCEAFIGALYLDHGYEVTKKFILDYVVVNLEEILAQGDHVDPKTHFQEMAQEHVNITPEYNLIEESGPDHSKHFEMGVYLAEELVATGTGSSKQKAELDAAEKAIDAKDWN